jgi:hypothetical protein
MRAKIVLLFATAAVVAGGSVTETLAQVYPSPQAAHVFASPQADVKIELIREEVIESWTMGADGNLRKDEQPSTTSKPLTPSGTPAPPRS